MFNPSILKQYLIVCYVLEGPIGLYSILKKKKLSRIYVHCICIIDHYHHLCTVLSNKHTDCWLAALIAAWPELWLPTVLLISCLVVILISGCGSCFTRHLLGCADCLTWTLIGCSIAWSVWLAAVGRTARIQIGCPWCFSLPGSCWLAVLADVPESWLAAVLGCPEDPSEWRPPCSELHLLVRPVAVSTLTTFL